MVAVLSINFHCTVPFRLSTFHPSFPPHPPPFPVFKTHLPHMYCIRAGILHPHRLPTPLSSHLVPVIGVLSSYRCRCRCRYPSLLLFSLSFVIAVDRSTVPLLYGILITVLLQLCVPRCCRHSSLVGACLCMALEIILLYF